MQTASSQDAVPPICDAARRQVVLTAQLKLTPADITHPSEARQTLHHSHKQRRRLCVQWLQTGARHPFPPSPYLGVRDGQAVHRLGRLKQLDLLDDVGLGAQDHHSLQPALSCGTRGGGRGGRGEAGQLGHFVTAQSATV